jgi:Na+/melibiose symporter-like transporter
VAASHDAGLGGGESTVRSSELLRHPAFLRLWAGQSISAFGDQVTLLAVPLIAVLVLEATPLEMGLLGAAQWAPFLLVGLLAGVWVDRLPRRPILIGADLGRALLLGSVPVAALLGLLRIEYLYAVAFLVGVLTVFFAVAYQAYLPSVLRRSALLDGNTRLEMSRSTAEIAGPGVAGALIQAVAAPIALALDALSFLVSALFVAAIRVEEPLGASRPPRRSIGVELGEGLRLVLGTPLLRAIAGFNATFNLFENAVLAIYVLYVTRELDIGPAVLGGILGIGGVGAFLGTLLAPRAARRLGTGPAIAVGALASGVGRLLVPLTLLVPGAAVPLLAAGQLALSMGITVYNLGTVSLRQAITPDRLQGRMHASMRFIGWGTRPVGALLGGVLASAIGFAPTLLVSAMAMLVGVCWLLLSPLPGLQGTPGPLEEPPESPRLGASVRSN